MDEEKENRTYQVLYIRIAPRPLACVGLTVSAGGTVCPKIVPAGRVWPHSPLPPATTLPCCCPMSFSLGGTTI